jgi:hypothetical protein
MAMVCARDNHTDGPTTCDMTVSNTMMMCASVTHGTIDPKQPCQMNARVSTIECPIDETWPSVIPELC